MNHPTPDIPRSTGMLIVAALTATVTVLLAGRMPGSMESFHGIFTGVGVTPPAAALFVMRFAYAWWVLAIASLAVLVWVAARSRVPAAEHRRMKLSLGALIALTVSAYGFVAYAIYVPIFEIGATV